MKMAEEKEEINIKQIPNSQYKLSFEDNKDDIYNLQITIKSEFIIFKLFQNNESTFNYYSKKFELSEIRNFLNLPLFYNSFDKIKKFIDELFIRKLYKLQREKENVIIIFKIPIAFEEIESKIKLNKINLDGDNFLYEEMIELKKKIK